MSDPSKLVLVHLNHGWRGKASDRDAEFVRKLARKFGAAFESEKIPTCAEKGESLEEVARADRKSFFERIAQKYERDGSSALVLTAHTQDDLFETQVWRFFTGAWLTHSEGILARHGSEFRPLLSVQKEDLREFLREEAQTYREDRTNHDPRFLRARMRRELIPRILEIFPGAMGSVSRNRPKLK